MCPAAGSARRKSSPPLFESRDVYHNWFLLIVFGIGFPLLYAWIAFPVVVRAVQTGVLEIRGRSYFRAQAPVHYWLGLAFGFFVLAVAAGTAATVLAIILSRLSSS
jgi:hypothetical protein